MLSLCSTGWYRKEDPAASPSSSRVLGLQVCSATSRCHNLKRVRELSYDHPVDAEDPVNTIQHPFTINGAQQTMKGIFSI
jgi:hypothetical protein